MRSHVLPSLGPEAAGLASLAVVTALNASLPMEVLCGHTGLGQLAWNAAMQRDIVMLHYTEGLSQKEIADQLKQPLGTVKTRIRLAMSKLRTLLADEDDTAETSAGT